MFGEPNIAYDVLALIKPIDPRTGDEIEFRFADRYAACDGYAWDGRITDAGDISEQVEGELRLTPVFSNFTITLNNSDNELTASLLEHVWSGAEASVYAVPRGASSLGEGLKIYGGYIAGRGGVDTDGGDVRLIIEDALKKYDVDLPRRTFKEYATDVLGYPEELLDIQDGKDGEYVPIVFGDWQDQTGRYLVEASLVDVGAKKLLVCDVPSGYALDSFGSKVQILRPDGSSDEKDLVDKNLSNGTAVIDSYTYTEGDRFFLRPRGLRASIPGMVSLRPEENPVAIANVLIQMFAGADLSVVDAGSYLVAKWALKKTKVRRVLWEQAKLGDILAELGMEAGFRARSVGGKIMFYVPDWLSMDMDWPHFGKNELLKLERFAVDPDGLAAGKWIAKALYNPREDGFELVKELGEEGRYGFVDNADIEFHWLYELKPVRSRLMSLEFLFGRHVPKVFELRLSHAAMELKPLDGFWCELPWLFDESQPFMVLESNRDIAGGVVSIKALWLGYVFDVGRWTSDEQPSWADSTEQQRRYWGYWTNDDGLCDPADPSSDMSNWAP